jgi:hypothetical protein
MIQARPYFSLSRAVSVPCVIMWDERTVELLRVEGPCGLADRATALEASRSKTRQLLIDTQ